MNKNKLQAKRKARVRNKIKGISERSRLIVTRTNAHIYAQIVDPTGKIVATASDKSVEKKATKTEKATIVGQDLAKKAKKAKVTEVAFDRGYYKYHGRVKALAEAARSEGLEF